MATTNTNRASKAVISVTDIDENSRDVWFEGKILNRYGTFDFVRSGNLKRASGSSLFPYLHCDLIDRECLTTITMTIAGDVIHHHEEKIRAGTYVRVESFGVKRKHAGGFQKGDMPFAILVLQNTQVVVLPPFELELLPIFYTETCIRDFKKRSHESFPMATFSAVVVGVRGHYKSANNDDYCQVIVADGIGEEDHDTVGFSRAFHDEYTKIKNAFESGENVMVMFKNITTTSKYDRFLKTDAFTIVTPVIDEEERMKLIDINSRIHNCSQADCREVEGCLTVQNPTVPPFKRICAVCRVQNVVLISSGKYYCKKCECNQEVEFLPFIKAKILEANARDVQVSVEGEWLSALVRMPVTEFIKTGRREQIKLLSQLRLHGRFSLTPTSYLAGYEECNLDVQGDIKESCTLNSILDIQSQSNPIESTPISDLSVPSLTLQLENSPANLPSRAGVKRRLIDKLDSVKKSTK